MSCFFCSPRCSTAFAVKIFKTYGSDSIKIVKENPYRLADDIWESVLKPRTNSPKYGYDKESYARIRSGIMYALNELPMTDIALPKRRTCK